jgi:hypothetical protein
MSDNSMPKVVSLRGEKVTPQGAPHPNVVEYIESLLVRARRGEITSIAVAFVRGNGFASEGTSIGSRAIDMYALHSALATCLHRMTRELDDNSYDAEPIGDDNEGA